jgi:ABC-type phosphate/phosphonate transport system substrate-binding protein
MTIAALPMYDWPEARAEVDALWADLRTRFLAAGIDAPETLARRNADLPAVPGGIRDGEGSLIAPDPATLPPDAFSLPTLWKHPGLLFSQTCWGPMESGLAEHVVVIGQPSYDGIEGGGGELYSSAVLMRGGEKAASPSDGRAVLPIEMLRNVRLAFNSTDSMSGILALTRDLEALGKSLAIFSDRIETGSHRASIAAVAEGRADVCAVDCRSWHLARLYEPAAKDIRVVGWTARRKGLPFITSRHTPPPVVAKLRSILSRM